MLHLIPPQVAPYLPEGPLRMSEEQVLVWVCLGAGRAYRLPPGCVSSFHICCLGFRSLGGLLLVNIPTRHVRTESRVQTLITGPAPVVPPGRHGGSLQTFSSVFPQKHRVLRHGPLPLLILAPSCGSPSPPLPAPHPSGSPDAQGMCFLVSQVTGGWSPLRILIQGFKLLRSLRAFIPQGKSG